MGISRKPALALSSAASHARQRQTLFSPLAPMTPPLTVSPILSSPTSSNCPFCHLSHSKKSHVQVAAFAAKALRDLCQEDASQHHLVVRLTSENKDTLLFSTEGLDRLRQAGCAQLADMAAHQMRNAHELHSMLVSLYDHSKSMDACS